MKHCMKSFFGNKVVVVVVAYIYLRLTTFAFVYLRLPPFAYV